MAESNSSAIAMSREPYPPEAHIAHRVAEDAMEAGVLTYPMQGSVDGTRGDHLLLAPPFTISTSQIEMIASALCAARSANSKTRTAATQEAPLPSHPFREWLAAASLACRRRRPRAGTAFALAPRTSTVSVTGYSPAAGEHELTIEKETRAFASPDQISKFHRFLTAEPHPAGSERNNELARWVAEQWKQQGLEDVTIREYDVLNSTPREISLEMTAPKEYRATLREAPYDADSDTKNPRASGAFLGYSASGEVTASVVYAHSGNPEDYDLLGQQGISVRGKIVLVRYSNPYSYRGFKALTAEREGAAAILIYSDPAEDGFKQGKVFPDGPWGPETHIQRGAITYDFLEPGDPLTPGWASVPGAKRIPASEAISLPKIMGVPLSWHDARPLLENMDGPVAPDSWQGGLPFKYHVGGERVRVHLKVDMDTSIQPYYVTEARIRGAELPDEWIVLGNHRDAWVFGGVDPSSGTASMLEMTRDLGQMLKRGIRPRRTLVICSWDGEEYALTGSTEWGEQFADELKQKAVAYLNVDSSASGPVFHGTPSRRWRRFSWTSAGHCPHRPARRSTTNGKRLARMSSTTRKARRRFGIGGHAHR